jgi:hypothetical protein
MRDPADARSVKLLTRAGMGMCQGRICGPTVACVLAQLSGRATDDADLLAFAPGHSPNRYRSVR